ncbi:MAG: secretin N-terminal domain-containing protein [Sedimentisphaerales bacterium]
MKSKGLKLLTVLTFVIAVCVIAIAENGDEASKQKEVPVTQPIDQNTQGQIGDLKQNDVPPTQPGDQTTQEPNKDSKPKKASTPLDQRMQKTISVDFRNTPIEDVIRIMAEQASVDIITNPNVTGNVTATLTNVPLSEALDNILTAHGYAYIAGENMIRVAPAGEINEKAERLVSRIYRINYADVKEVEKALMKFISKRGSISSNFGTSNIIVTDTESKVKIVDSFIEEIDRITPQIMVEARVYDITSTEGFDIWAQWAAGRNNPITSVATHQDITTNNLTGVKTVDTSDTDKDTATAWQNSAAGLAATSYAYRKSNPFIGGSFDKDTAGTIRLGFLDTINLDIELNILRSQVGAKLLANPRILVLDNETAEFKIISEIPYTEQSQTSAGGNMTSTQFKDVGVELKVTPHVTRDGMIRLHILPQFSVVSALGSIIPNSGGLRGVPTIDNREVDTKTLVKDGQTVVLGGLRKRTVSQDVSKIPVLGDVPIMGNFFKSVSEQVKTTELVIFITPRVIIEPTLSPAENKDFEATEFGGPTITYTGDEQAEMAQKAGK